MRLVGDGTTARQGRLEVFHDGEWGTVCKDGFTDVAAKIACNGLGFGYVIAQITVCYGTSTRNSARLTDQRGSYAMHLVVAS